MMGAITQTSMVISFSHIQYCPITGNQATAMTSIESAVKLCRRQRGRRPRTWCSTCKGKHLTKYVKIVPLELLAAKEDRMVKKTSADATQAQKNMLAIPKGGQDGKSEYEADIEATAQYLRDELLEQKSIIKDREKEIAKLGKVIDEMDGEIAQLNKVINEMEKNDQASYDAHRVQIIAKQDKIEQLEKMLLASTAEVNRLRAIEDAYLNDRQVDGKQTNGPGRDAALLDVALDVLARVSGDAHRHILALREVA